VSNFDAKVLSRVPNFRKSNPGTEIHQQAQNYIKESLGVCKEELDRAAGRKMFSQALLSLGEPN
jgi:hypothetical protein